MKNFKKVLKQWRIRNNLTQEDAIKILGGNINTYRGWEQGKHEPTQAFQRAIAELLSK